MSRKFGNGGMAHYRLTNDKTRADWESYRQAFLKYYDAAWELAHSYGATSWTRGFAGGVVALGFPHGVPVPLFCASRETRGAHSVLSRGRTPEQKAAIADFNAKSEVVKAMFPDPDPIGQAHGFINRMTITVKKTDGETDEYRQYIGNVFNPIQGTWFGKDAEIIVFAPDVLEAVAQVHADYAPGSTTHMRRPNCELVGIDLDGWTVPDGYERISDNEFALLQAQFDVEKEREALKNA